MNKEGFILQLRGIVKRFPGVTANDGIDLSVHRGEIHCLLGENGAGKTTLMRILYGLYQQDDGEICLNSQTINITSPRDALDRQIGMVHQHFRLVPPLSVEENILLGLDEGPGPFLNLKRTRKKIQHIGEEYGLQVDPQAKIWQLSVGQQQRVEILKALYRNAKILIMDEPTSVLTPQEVNELFTTLRTLVDDGLTIIFITHKLDEVMQVSDRVTVLRKGKLVDSLVTSETTKAELAQLMVGREVIFRLDKPPTKKGENVLSVNGLCAQDNRGLPALSNVSFEIHAGEILGVAGVSGNGQAQLAETITGLRAVTNGRVMLNGENITRWSTRRIAENGVAYIPAERIRVGIVPNMSICENLILKKYRHHPFSRWGFVSSRQSTDYAKQVVDEYQISTPSIDVLARLLSGGNIQRLVLARELSGNPQLVVAAHPTYGLDVGATEQIRQILLRQRKQGTAILLISEDLDEIMQLSDRILVLFSGGVMGIVDATSAKTEEIGLMMAGAVDDGDNK